MMTCFIVCLALSQADVDGDDYFRVSVRLSQPNSTVMTCFRVCVRLMSMVITCFSLWFRPSQANVVAMTCFRVCIRLIERVSTRVVVVVVVVRELFSLVTSAMCVQIRSHMSEVTRIVYHTAPVFVYCCILTTEGPFHFILLRKH